MRSFCLLTSMEKILLPNCSLLAMLKHSWKKVVFTMSIRLLSRFHKKLWMDLDETLHE